MIFYQIMYDIFRRFIILNWFEIEWKYNRIYQNISCAGIPGSWSLPRPTCQRCTFAQLYAPWHLALGPPDSPPPTPWMGARRASFTLNWSLENDIMSGMSDNLNGTHHDLLLRRMFPDTKNSNDQRRNSDFSSRHHGVSKSLYQLLSGVTGGTWMYLVKKWLKQRNHS